MRQAAFAVGMALLVPLSPARARAQQTPPSTDSATPNDEALIAEGIALREQGRDREALELFVRAAALAASPRATAQIGLAQQALGHWVEAEAGLRTALEQGTDPWI